MIALSPRNPTRSTPSRTNSRGRSNQLYTFISVAFIPSAPHLSRLAGSCLSVEQFLSQSGVDQLAVSNDDGDSRRVSDIDKWVAVEQEKIRELALLDASELVGHVKQDRRVHNRCDQSLLGAQPGFDEPL